MKRHYFILVVLLWFTVITVCDPKETNQQEYNVLAQASGGSLRLTIAGVEVVFLPDAFSQSENTLLFTIDTPELSRRAMEFQLVGTSPQASFELRGHFDFLIPAESGIFRRTQTIPGFGTFIVTTPAGDDIYASSESYFNQASFSDTFSQSISLLMEEYLIAEKWCNIQGNGRFSFIIQGTRANGDEFTLEVSDIKITIMRGQHLVLYYKRENCTQSTPDIRNLVDLCENVQISPSPEADGEADAPTADVSGDDVGVEE